MTSLCLLRLNTSNLELKDGLRFLFYLFFGAYYGYLSTLVELKKWYRIETGLLLRKTLIWVKDVELVLLVISGIYLLFYNDIIGPMAFQIRDRPIDMPAQFYHSWRYFWVVAYLYEVSWTWGFLAVPFLLGYKIIRKWNSEPRRLKYYLLFA